MRPGLTRRRSRSWQRLRFGLDARALLGKRIVIDQLAVDGLQVNLQRNAAGEGNWNFTSPGDARRRREPAPASPLRCRWRPCSCAIRN